MIDRADLVTRAKYLKALRDLGKRPNLRQARAMHRRKRARQDLRVALIALLVGLVIGAVMAP